MEVQRHEIDVEHAATVRAMFEDWLDLSTDDIVKRPSASLSTRLTVVTDLVGHAGASDATGPVLGRALRHGAQLGAALFELAAGHGDVTIRIGEATLVVAATGPTSGSHGGNWRTSFWLATIVRDPAATASLYRFGVPLLRRSVSRVDECQYRFIDALQAYTLDDPRWTAKLRVAREEAASARPGAIGPDYTRDILVPEMELLAALGARDADAFNQALHDALVRHREYPRDRPDRDPASFLALGPLALASLAHDAGMAVTVRSDYIPAHIYEGHVAVRRR